MTTDVGTAPVTAADAAKATRTLRTFIDINKLTEDVGFTIETLQDAMLKHTGLFVYYASQTIEARKQFEKAKAGVDILKAKLDDEHRTTLKAGGAKTTEGAIEAAVTSDTRYIGAQARLIEAQGIWKLCEVAESAFSQRRDMLLELARDRRKEREGELLVKARDEAGRIMDERLKAVVASIRGNQKPSVAGEAKAA